MYDKDQFKFKIFIFLVSRSLKIAYKKIPIHFINNRIVKQIIFFFKKLSFLYVEFTVKTALV